MAKSTKAEGKRVDHSAFDGQETAAHTLATLEVTSDQVQALADQTMGQMYGDQTPEAGQAGRKLWACKVDGCPERFESADTEQEAKDRYKVHQQIVNTDHPVKAMLVTE